MVYIDLVFIQIGELECENPDTLNAESITKSGEKSVRIKLLKS